MYTKLSIPERLKDLRVVDKHLTLEQLAEQTGLSRSALGKYESDDYKDISPFAIATLAEFYGVSTDYLMAIDRTVDMVIIWMDIHQQPVYMDIPHQIHNFLIHTGHSQNICFIHAGIVYVFSVSKTYGYLFPFLGHVQCRIRIERTPFLQKIRRI